jgi:hypothetical protein
MTKETKYVTQPQLSVYIFVLGVNQAHVPEMQRSLGDRRYSASYRATFFASFMGYFKTFYQMMIRLSWLGHVEIMSNERLGKTIYKSKPYATRPKGRPRVRWEDDVRNDSRKMGVNSWKQRTQERKQWKEIIE